MNYSRLLGSLALGSLLIISGCSEHSHESEGGHDHHDMQSQDVSHAHAEADSSQGLHAHEGHSHDNMETQDNMEGNHSMGGHDMHKMMDAHHGDGHHGDGHHGMHHGDSLAGKPGLENEVSRTIQVEANDSMRFVHEPFNIKNGETIKFVITNKGAVSHEFAIGTKDEHIEHGKMMMANPMMHHGPGGNAITIEPGKTGELIWTFEEAWEVEAACNIPGHYQAGMHSPVVFTE